MNVPRSVRIIFWIFLLIAVFWAWYMVAADYGYKAVSGTYIFSRGGEVSTLVLKDDRSFRQELSRAGKVEHAQGSWRRIGEGGVVFSREFLKVSGQEVRLDGEADAEIEKQVFGLFPSINFNPAPGGPTFRKKLFR